MQLDYVPKRFPKFFASTPLASASKNASISSEPVDAFIQRLTEGQETIIEQNYTGALDPGYAILRAQEQQRLPPLEMYKLTGQPIEWPQFIERFRDQVHNKSTLTDGDRMAYLYQHLEGEAKKAVESLGVSGHSYPAALKTLKKTLWKPPPSNRSQPEENGGRSHCTSKRQTLPKELLLLSQSVCYVVLQTCPDGNVE